MYEGYANPNLYQRDVWEIEKDMQKAYNHKAIQLAYDETKERQRQRTAENKKKQTDEVAFRENGELEIVTVNLDIEAKKRKVCNFIHPKLTRLYTEGESEEFFVLECVVGGRETEVFFSAEKAGDPLYLLKKLNAKGCEICAPSRRLQEEYATKIWALLLNTSSSECNVPSEYGWRILPDGTMEFIDENAMLWRDIKKWAK